MNRDFYVKNFKKVLGRSFNFEENKIICGEEVALYGVWSEEFGRTLFSKDKVVDKYECNEHFIVKEVNFVGESQVRDFINYLKIASDALVKPHIEHKATYMTGILVYNESFDMDFKIRRLIEKFKSTKNYRFSLYGWCIFRIVVIDGQKGRVYFSKDAKDIGEKISKSLETKEVLCM